MTTATKLLTPGHLAASDFKPGSFGLSVISGSLGKAVWAGQKYLAGDDSPFTHAWEILDDGTVLEAEPGGARISPISEYLDHDLILICDRRVQDKLQQVKDRNRANGVEPPDPEEFYGYVEAGFRAGFVEAARLLEGAPYGYLQYPYIGLAAHGIRPAWLRKLIGNRRIICSQAIDRVAQMNGSRLFDDGRWEGEVTPGDLYRYATQPPAL